MQVNSTRLRFVSSKNAMKIVSYCNSLPYKIEIKGNPILDGRVFVLFFVIPDSIDKDEAKWGDLDKVRALCQKLKK